MTSTITEVDATTELAQLRTNVRAAAAEYLRIGYGTREGWNAFLVRVGLTPMATRRVKAAITLTLSKGFDVPAGQDPQEWIDSVSQGSGARGWFSYYEFDTPLSEADANAYSVSLDEEVTPGVEGVEPDPDASTDDLRTYKRLIRREGLKLRNEFGWCEGGTSDAFEKIGLARIGRVRVPMEVVTRRQVLVDVDDAEDQEDAVEIVTADPERVKSALMSREQLVEVKPLDPRRPAVGRYLRETLDESCHGAYDDEQCGARDDGFSCTRHRDHNDEYGHVAAYEDGEICHVWAGKGANVA